MLARPYIKSMRLRICFLIGVLIFCAVICKAQDTASIISTADTAHVEKGDTAKYFWERGIIGKVYNYFGETNKVKEDKKLDFSIIGGPAYSNDTKLSLGIIGAALYRTALGDSITKQSDVTLYTEVSITGYYNIGIRGNHFSPRNSYRANYKLSFKSLPTYFWGIGYDNNHLDSNEREYLHLETSFDGSIEWHVLPNFYIGPSAQFNYTKATDVVDEVYDMWEQQRLSPLSLGLGVNFTYDTRDCITYPMNGWYAALQQRFFPRGIGNKNAFSSTEFTLANYFGLWKGGTMAWRLHGLFTYGNTPWSMMATLGGSTTMRGYYEGRYRDKCAADVVVELRQHVWRRNSIVVWVGAGSVFSSPKELQMREILPNFGIGYRWEFKHRVNVRLDIGFGKGESGVVFNINEAF